MIDTPSVNLSPQVIPSSNSRTVTDGRIEMIGTSDLGSNKAHIIAPTQMPVGKDQEFAPEVDVQAQQTALISETDYE